MMGRSHLLLAGAAYIALAVHPIETPLGPLAAPVLSGSPIPEGRAALIATTALAALAGLGPDIDKRGSTISRHLGLAGTLLSWGIEHTVGHRGPLHSLLGGLLAFLLGNLAGAALGVAGLGGVVAFGWIAHLIADGWTNRGVPWLWPIGGSIRPPITFATNTWVEQVVLALVLAACAWWGAGGPGWRWAG